MAIDFAAELFQLSLHRALERVSLVLDAERTPCLAGDAHHQYEDKYLLAEFLTNAAAASQINCLGHLGLRADGIAELREWAEKSTVCLRFVSDERCSFVREESRDVESPTKHVQEVSVGGVAQKTLTSKVVTKVTEYFWKYEVDYRIVAVRLQGGEEEQKVLLSRTGDDELKTSAKNPPRLEARIPAFSQEVDIRWLLKQLPSGSSSPGFKVDRSHKKCRTPRRNPEVEAAFNHFANFGAWASKCSQYLETLLSVQPDPSRKLDFNIVRQTPLVLAVVPLLRHESGSVAAAATGATGGAGTEAAAAAPAAAAAGAAGTVARLLTTGDALLEPGDANRLLQEEVRALDEWVANVGQAYPSSGVATATEGQLVVVLRHLGQVWEQWRDSVSYLEELLKTQLYAAIGKEVTPTAFAEYMRFHDRKLFADEYAPSPFCFAVRRSGRHAPEGTLSVEQRGVDADMFAPIATLAARGERPHPMQFPLNASTDVHFAGDRYLHAYLQHQWGGFDDAGPVQLVARARQFSSMIVLVGRIASATVFEPTYAAIVKNKDELKIPLELSTIPTPKEFKDAIESLSPEQQAFAKAFRAMQLESTLFGVLVVQIKPQLEKVLNLAPDSLTKEIKLTQDLMQLFIKYQIPSDLLSFDDGAVGLVDVEVVAATPAERLQAVKDNVKAMQEMISGAKEEEVAQRKQEAQYAYPRSPVSSSDSGPRVLRASSMEDECCAEPPMIMARCAMPMMEMMEAQAEMCYAAPAPVMYACAAAAPEPVLQSLSFQAQSVPAAAPAQAWEAAAAQPPTAQQQPAQAAAEPQQAAQGSGAGAAEGGAVDYTQVPKEMDQRFEQLDADSALRPTIIKASDVWTKRAQKALLAEPEETVLCADEQKQEKDAAFDLLDALTKSGALTVDHAALHVVIAATHCFAKSVTETVIEDNINPIDKVERSALIMASVVHKQPAKALIRPTQHSRVSGSSPMLFVEDGAS